MARKILQNAFLPLDLFQIQTGADSRLLTWRGGGKSLGSARINFVSNTAGLEVTRILMEESRMPPTHRVSFRYARLKFGEVRYFACPRCDRRARILYFEIEEVDAPPVCRACTGARYASQIHYSAHPLNERRRALKKLQRAQELLERPRLGPRRRARAMELLTQGETQLREHFDRLAARASATAADLEGLLVKGQTA